MKICQVCKTPNQNFDTVCGACGASLKYASTKLVENCSRCGLSRSRRIKTKNGEQNLCYNCCLVETQQINSKNTKKYVPKNEGEALYIYYTKLYLEALFYGDDASIYERKMQIAHDMELGINKHLWKEIIPQQNTSPERDKS